MLGLPRALLRHLVFFKLVYMAFTCITSLTMPHFDHSAKLLFIDDPSKNIVGLIMEHLLTGFIRWDSIYFVLIARDGYTKDEKLSAFLPFLPITLRVLAECLQRTFFPFLSKTVLICLVGVILVNASHLLASMLLYRITKRVFKSDRFAQLSSLLYMLNGGAAFLTGLYNEAPCAALAFAGFFAYYKKQRWLAALAWALASLLRSNSVLLSGFFVYDALIALRSIDQWRSKRLLKKFITSITRILIVFSGITTWHLYCRSLHCPGALWCSNPLSTLYMHVQRKYWNVGFLNYWQLRNIPNFMLALPVTIVILMGAKDYMKGKDWIGLI
jgi:GPI mannosyltransferase 2